jgi:CHASE3 domain sensor protein
VSARTLSGFAATQAILLATGANSYRSALRLAENARRVGHTPEIVSTLLAPSADFLHATSRRLGYALTRDEDLAERARTTAQSIRRGGAAAAERRQWRSTSAAGPAAKHQRSPSGEGAE